MNEQTNKSKLGYPLAEKDCTRAKLSQGEKLQNLLDVEAAEGEVNTALCSTCCLECPLTQMPQGTHLRAGSWHLSIRGLGDPTNTPDSPSGSSRCRISWWNYKNLPVTEVTPKSESKASNSMFRITSWWPLFTLWRKQREAETCSRCPCASELHGGLQEVMLRFQANLRLICSFVDMYASGCLWIIRWCHFPRTDDNQHMNKFIHSYQYKSRF